MTPRRHEGKPNEMRAAAVKPRARSGMSLRGISDVTVLRWIRKVAQALPAGRRDDAALRKLPNKVGCEDCIFVTDDWNGDRLVIPQDRSFTGRT